MSNPIYVIVNTYDKQAVFAKLLYLEYQRFIGKENQQLFIYRIPYNSDDSIVFDFFKDCSNVELIKTPRNIKGTILELIKGIPLNHLIYWAIDDRIPSYIVNKSFIDLIHFAQKINSQDNPDLISRIATKTGLNSRDYDLNDFIETPRQKFYRYNYLGMAQRFWEHHFVSVRLMKFIFSHPSIQENAGPGIFSRFLKKIALGQVSIKPKFLKALGNHYYPSLEANGMIGFIESTKGRENKISRKSENTPVPVIMPRALKLLKEHQLPIPNFDEKDCFKGAGYDYLIASKENNQ